CPFYSLHDLLSSLISLPPLLTLFPYTTLFRSPWMLDFGVKAMIIPALARIRNIGHCNLYTFNKATKKASDVQILQVKVVPPSNVDRKSTRLNSSHVSISYAVFCLKKKTINRTA